jgi:Erv1 / Alr family
MGDTKVPLSVRWIDPDVWGFRAWSVLFALARNVSSAQQKGYWYALLRLLPFVLPCHTCRCCCGKFISKNPPEKREPVKWLCELRQEVAARNLKSADCNRLDRCLLATEDAESRFKLRENLPFLWTMDAFLFLSCVAMTLNLSVLSESATWSTFATLISRLSAIDLKLALLSKNHTSVDEALGWIMASPKCPGHALAALLATITVKVRILTNPTAPQ